MGTEVKLLTANAGTDRLADRQIFPTLGIFHHGFSLRVVSRKVPVFGALTPRWKKQLEKTVAQKKKQRQ